MAKKLTKRDKLAKQLLIEYLEEDTDERLWQAVNNFGKLYGLTAHFLITRNTEDDERDLWFQESDAILEENRRLNEELAKKEKDNGKEEEGR